MSTSCDMINLFDRLFDDNSMAYIRHVLRQITNYRLVTYTSKITDATKPIIPINIMRIGYGLSFCYIISDIGLKLYDFKIKTYQKDSISGISNKKLNSIIWYKGLDLTLWHTSASIILPATVIHIIVHNTDKLQTKYSNKFYHKYTSLRFRSFFPTIIGISSIPFIIKPIDKLTDLCLDKLIRPLYPVKIE